MHLKIRQMLAKVLILMMVMQILGLYPKEVAYAQYSTCLLSFEGGVFIRAENGNYIDVQGALEKWIKYQPTSAGVATPGAVTTSGTAVVISVEVENAGEGDLIFINPTMPMLYEEIGGNKVPVGNSKTNIFQNGYWVSGGQVPGGITPEPMYLSGTASNITLTSQQAGEIQARIDAILYIKDMDGKYIRLEHLGQMIYFENVMESSLYGETMTALYTSIWGYISVPSAGMTIQFAPWVPTVYAGVGGQLVPIYFKLVFNGTLWEVQTVPVNVIPDSGTSTETPSETRVEIPIPSASESNETAFKDALKVLTDQLSGSNLTGGGLSEATLQKGSAIIENVSKLSPERTLQQLDNIKIAVEGLGNLLNQDISETDKEKVKAQIESLVKTVISNASRQPIPQKSVEIEGQRVNVGDLNPRDIDAAIQRAKVARTALLEQATGLIGEYAVSNIPLTITLVATSDSDRRGVSIPEGTADFLRESGVESVGLDMGPVQYTLRPEQINQNGQSELFLVSQWANDLAGQGGPVWSRLYQKMGVGSLLAIQWQDLIPQSPVYELNRMVNGQVDNEFDKPIEIGFDLKKGLSAEEANQMAIVRMDEVTGEQVLVGGQYDPLTGKISCFRDHLSKYTVVKSNKTFADVDDSWAKTEINALLNKGVIKKTDKGFEPTAKMTREELVGWIAKTYGLKEKDISLSFKDVDKSSPYYKEIAAAYELGIISGKDGQTFDPKGTVTREEVATVVMKAKKTLEGEKMVKEIEATIAKAKDKDKVSSWAKESVATATEKGILTADAGNVKPKGEVTKEEAANMIYKAYFK